MDHHLLAIRVFARVVEAGTFTRAADLLKMPNSTVTKLVQNLEDHLRVKLLNRTTRRVTVTSEGAAYYERMQRLLQELDDVEASVANTQASPRGRLRIDVGSIIANNILLPALPEFHARYPDIQLDIGVSDRPVDLIADNVDCVLRGGNLSDQSLVARRIGSFSFVTCATPAYLERYGAPQHPSELEDGHKLVQYFYAGNGRLAPLDFNRNGERIEVRGHYAVAVNDASAYFAATLAGLGISQPPCFMALPHIERGELVPVLPEWTSDPVSLYVVYPPNRHLSAKLRVFVDWVAELFARLPQN
jgi:DNA-binding transcriptional LysR family regulator